MDEDERMRQEKLNADIEAVKEAGGENSQEVPSLYYQYYYSYYLL
jgi:hypothetical protein